MQDVGPCPNVDTEFLTATPHRVCGSHEIEDRDADGPVWNFFQLLQHPSEGISELR